jgi:5-(carboxyamino)imidazole ribonucleotide mutase
MSSSPTRPRVAIVYGSASDAQTMSKAGATLGRFGVEYEEAVLSAHRAPRTLSDWVDGLRGRGVAVGIAQMPPGVAVATVGLNNATNAAVLAVQILALSDAELSAKLSTYKDDFEKAAADGIAQGASA